jgi:putative FmdB family regulatory protein
MPIYEYQCTACGKHFEEMQKVNEPALINCPDCGKPKLQKLISQTQFQLKGGGWYATDYKGSKKEEKKESAAKETKSTASDTKTETKTKTKKE